MKNNNFRHKSHFHLRIIIIIFLVMFFSSLITGAVAWYFTFVSKTNLAFFITVFLSYIAISVLITSLSSRTIFKKINLLMYGMQEIAEGNFTIRLDFEKPAEFKNLSDNFNLMAEELSSIQILRNDFISTFSHELKTPIVAIKGFAKLLKNENLSESERQEYVDIILNESTRLSEISSNILLLTKLESQSIVIERSSYQLDEQIRQCIVLLTKKWEKKNLDFNLGLPKTVYFGNEELLQHLWINLIENAIKFSADNKQIKIYLEETDTDVVITVIDEGIGMSEEHLKNIFNRFYQINNPNFDYGSGLGLSIVKRIVELADGDIKVKSTLGIGTTFTITLPKTL